MQRELVSENVYWFQSEIYAQVTAGIIVGPQWAIVVDTLAVPEESIAIQKFVIEDLGVPVRYLINTHSQSDHAWGNCYFPGATIIGHTKCAEILREKGIPDLEVTKKQNPLFQDSKIILPHLTFAHGELTLKVGKKNVIILLTPGNSPDGISVFVEDDRILFAGDSFMPVPQLTDGRYKEALDVMKKFSTMGLENIIQGHGEIILRGEIDDAIEENITYINNVREVVEKAAKKRNPAEFLNDVNIESCGKSRVYLGGLAEQLHKRNLVWMFKQIVAEGGLPKSEDEYDEEPLEDDFDDLNFDEPYYPSDSTDPEDQDNFYDQGFEDEDDDEF